MQAVQAIRFNENLGSLGRAEKALATAPQQLLPTTEHLWEWRADGQR